MLRSLRVLGMRKHVLRVPPMHSCQRPASARTALCMSVMPDIHDFPKHDLPAGQAASSVLAPTSSGRAACFSKVCGRPT